MATERSLYDRLGGIDAITAVVNAVADRQLKDDRINEKFARTNRDRLVKEFVDQICQATGGPCKYTGLSMADAHYNMAVTNGEFEAFVQDVVAVLDDFKVGKAEQDELLNILAPFPGRDRRCSVFSRSRSWRSSPESTCPASGVSSMLPTRCPAGQYGGACRRGRRAG